MLRCHEPTTVTIPNAVASRRDEDLFVVRAPNGRYVSCSGLTTDFEEASVFYDLQKAEDFALDRTHDLEASGAAVTGSFFTVERFTRTFVVSDLRKDWIEEEDL